MKAALVLLWRLSMPSTPELDTLIEQAAAKHDIPVSWLRAFCRQESDFDPKASVTTGTDGARGGAYGLCQMTLKTAQGLGYQGTPSGLLDPATNLDVAAKLISTLKMTTPQLEDVASRYNSGVKLSTALWISQEAVTPTGDPDIPRRWRYKHTVDVYVPNVVRFEQLERATAQK